MRLIILVWNYLSWLLWVKKGWMKRLDCVVFDILYHCFVIQKTYIALYQWIHLPQYYLYLIIFFRLYRLSFILFYLWRKREARSAREKDSFINTWVYHLWYLVWTQYEEKFEQGATETPHILGAIILLLIQNEFRSTVPTCSNPIW